MKCYCHHEQNYFFDYFDDPVLDNAIIYVSNVPVQYNKREGRHTKFIDNLTSTTFVATKRDQEILLSQRNNASNMSSNLNILGN